MSQIKSHKLYFYSVKRRSGGGGNHTLAIINGTEKYEHLKTALADIIKEVSELKTLLVDQNKFEIEYFLCCF